MGEKIYIVTKDKEIAADQDIILITDDAEKAKKRCDEAYEEVSAPYGRKRLHTFIEVWEIGKTSPEYVTRQHPDQDER